MATVSRENIGLLNDKIIVKVADTDYRLSKKQSKVIARPPTYPDFAREWYQSA
jgi:hypothetical protein